MSLEVGTSLIPFKKVFYPSKMKVEDMPCFKIKRKRYGTQGYMYELIRYNTKVKRWGVWYTEYNHNELFKFFRLATPAEEVLFFV
jgi:adenine specific DNA methylase Mod